VDTLKDPSFTVSFIWIVSKGRQERTWLMPISNQKSVPVGTCLSRKCQEVPIEEPWALSTKVDVGVTIWPVAKWVISTWRSRG
jgi:hypothetical protein